jgi:branched-chain amino acid transport system permease protein
VARLRSREARPTLVAALVVAVFVGYVIHASWAGNPITFESLLFFVVVGITLGSIYAIAAAGLVVTYTTSGIFNFAQGAIGMLMAYVYWELKVDLGLQTVAAFILTVAVVAPLVGAAIERLLMRRLGDAPLVAQLVVTIGLMLALIGLAATIWNPNTSRTVGTFFGTDGFHVSQTFVPWYRLITILTGVGIAVGLRFVLFRTRLGVGMRAVVDDRDLAALNGARPGRMSMVSWALGAAMAAMAGIFLAEELSALSVQTLTLLIVDAFAAAIIGRLRNLPLTYVGGILIGLALSFQENFLSWAGRWSTAATAIPTVILFLALLFVPQARIEGRRLQRHVTAHVPTLRTAVLGMVVLFGAVAVAGGTLGRPDVRRLAVALVTAFIMVSLVPLTGWAGQISLAQITFAGAGAFAFAEWAPHLGTVGGLLVAAAFAVPFGILMALPALRLQGLYLALASMAFARMAEFVFFDQPEVFGSSARRIGTLRILGFDLSKPFEVLGVHFGADVGLLLLITALFGAVGVLIVWLRRGPFGRRLVALRDSPAACATFGVNLTATKLVVFALSAAIAGFAGALFGVLLGSAGTTDFQMLSGLPYLLLVVVGGVSVVSGALLGGLLLQSFTWLAEIFPGVAALTWLQRIGPGLAGIGIGREPDGIVPAAGHALRSRRSRRSTGTAARPGDPPVPTAGG